LELRCADGAGGGPEKTILLGAAQADPCRFRVTVCYLRHSRETDRAVANRAEQLGVDLVEIAGWPVSMAVMARLARLVREHDIDIVHAHDYKTNLLALGLARMAPIVPLSTAHGWTGHLKRERWLYYPVDRQLLKRFPRVIAVSSEIRNVLLASGARPERVTTILNGIDHRRFRPNPARREPARRQLGFQVSDLVVGAVGRLERQKRFDLLLDAWAALRSRFPHAQLVIAGEGSERGTLEEQIRRRDLLGSVRLLGHVPGITDLHHALDLLVQSSDYEGTPNAVLEAMAFETAVVATAAGGTAELMRDGVDGLVVRPGNALVLAEAMGQALANPDDRGRWSRAARRRVETDLSFEARMRALESIYEDLAAPVPVA
jgi:glycosyltransferase involved in cell wall biosynthesis